MHAPPTMGLEPCVYACDIAHARVPGVGCTACMHDQRPTLRIALHCTVRASGYGDSKDGDDGGDGGGDGDSKDGDDGGDGDGGVYEANLRMPALRTC